MHAGWGSCASRLAPAPHVASETVRAVLLHRGLFLEESGDQGGRFRHEGVAAGMDERDEGRAGFRRIERAVCRPRLARFVAAIDFADRFHGPLLPLELHQRIVLSGDVQRRLWLQFVQAFVRRGGRWGKCREHIAAHRPEQIGDPAAIRVPRGEDAFRVHFVVLLEPRERRVEELQVAVLLSAGQVLPARLRAFGIGETAGRVQPLHVNRDGFRPLFVHREAFHRTPRRAAVAVEDKDHRRRHPLRRIRCVNPRLARDAIDRQLQPRKPRSESGLGRRILRAGGKRTERREQSHAKDQRMERQFHDKKEWDFPRFAGHPCDRRTGCQRRANLAAGLFASSCACEARCVRVSQCGDACSRTPVLSFSGPIDPGSDDSWVATGPARQRCST